MAQGLIMSKLGKRDALLLYHKNVANGLIDSPFLWRTQK